MPLKDLLIALVVIVAWGVNFVVIKVGLDGLPPMLLGRCASCWWRFRQSCWSSGRNCPGAG